MVRGLLAVAAAQPSSSVAAVFGIVLLVILGSSALLVALLLLLAAADVTGRRASKRRSRAMRDARPAGQQDSRVAAGLAAPTRTSASNCCSMRPRRPAC